MMSASAKKSYRPETQLVHAGILRSQFGETSEAMFLTQGYVYESAASAERRFKNEEPGYQYSRYANPTVTMFEQRMAALEGAQAARATATGMAAVTTALMGQVRAGDHIVASKALFGSCLYVVQEHLPRYGVASTLVNGNDLSEWRKAVRPNTKTFFLESPTNPALEVIDIKAVAEIAHAARATLVVDNVFSTPLYQRPLELGADCVVYSATKHIDGQGRCLGGVILASDKFIQDHVQTLIRQTGPSISPFNAWVLLKGLETLAVRVRQQTDTAATLAVALGEHPKISRLIYPGRPDHPQADIVRRQMHGGSTLVAFEIKGGRVAAFRFQDALRLVRISNNLGDAKSLITHPATTTHQRLTPAARAELGITDGLVRLSCGLEHPDDLVEDVFGALAAV
jgi:O-succinylhomoserine sulfhydrylase